MFLRPIRKTRFSTKTAFACAVVVDQTVAVVVKAIADLFTWQDRPRTCRLPSPPNAFVLPCFADPRPQPRLLTGVTGFFFALSTTTRWMFVDQAVAIVVQPIAHLGLGKHLLKASAPTKALCAVVLAILKAHFAKAAWLRAVGRQRPRETRPPCSRSQTFTNTAPFEVIDFTIAIVVHTITDLFAWIQNAPTRRPDPTLQTHSYPLPTRKKIRECPLFVASLFATQLASLALTYFFPVFLGDTVHLWRTLLAILIRLTNPLRLGRTRCLKKKQTTDPQQQTQTNPCSHRQTSLGAKVPHPKPSVHKTMNFRRSTLHKE